MKNVKCLSVARCQTVSANPEPSASFLVDAEQAPEHTAQVDIYDRPFAYPQRILGREEKTMGGQLTARIGTTCVGNLIYIIANARTSGLAGRMAEAAGGAALSIEDVSACPGAWGPCRGIGSGLVAYAVAARHRYDVPGGVIIPVSVEGAVPFYEGLGFVCDGPISMVLPEAAAVRWDAHLGAGRRPVDFKYGVAGGFELWRAGGEGVLARGGW